MCTPLERLKEAFEQSLKSNRSGKILFKLGAPLIDAQVGRRTPTDFRDPA
jgi:hypothetical protein